MADVELEIIDLSTMESVGVFQLDICVEKGFELNTGSYRFKATHLTTNEVLEQDRTIVDGVNSPLDFNFTIQQPDFDYTITESGGVYTITDANGNPVGAPSTDATVAILAVRDIILAGQSVKFVGNFTIASKVTWNVNTIKMDFTQANSSFASGIGFEIRAGYVEFYGGPYNPFTETGNHSTWTGAGGSIAAVFYSQEGCVFDGFELIGFNVVAPVVPASGGFPVVIQNCYFHDNNAGHIVFNNNGGNIVSHCRLGAGATGIMCNEGIPNNTIEYCEFEHFGISGSTHAMYLSGDSATTKGGNNVVKFCKFHDGNHGAAILIKCKDNDIHDNEFYNLDSNTVPLSIYSEWDNWTANNNLIYDNKFTNCYYGLWIHGGNRNSAGACIGEETNDNKVYSNTFTNVQHCFILDQIQCYWVRRTWIYYNTFITCGDIIDVTATSPPNMVADTVLAYNDFSQTTIPDERFKTEYENTMVYGNAGMADYNVPSPLPIPPPGTMSSVGISPLSATVYTDDTLDITAMVVGGTPSYTYEWFIDGASQGAKVKTETTDILVFDGSQYALGDHVVYCKVIDSIGTELDSLSAIITVAEPTVTKILTITTTIGGSTEPEPGSYERDIGTIVTVIAREDSGYTFKHFELDGEIKTQNPINVGMDADHTLLAVFVEAGPPLPLPLILLALGIPAGAGAIAVARKGGE